MTTDEATPETTVTFYTQSNSPIPERRRKVSGLLEEFSANEVIESYDLEFWPKVVCLDEMEGREKDDVVEMYNDLKEWAEEEGVSISPPFDVRDYRWEITGGRDTRLYTPHMALSVYEKGELKKFYPHRTGDGVQTISDGLKELAETTPRPQSATEPNNALIETKQ